MPQEKPPKNAIFLDEGVWIEQVDLVGRIQTEQSVDIDPMIQELEPMWRSLETYCEAGCCGIDAFDFSGKNISDAATSIDVAGVCDLLSRLQSHLHPFRARLLVSKRLNNYFDSASFDALLDYLRREFARSVSA